MVKKILLIILIIGIAILSGCQTVQGIGKDITWTGEATANLLSGDK